MFTPIGEHALHVGLGNVGRLSGVNTSQVIHANSLAARAGNRQLARSASRVNADRHRILAVSSQLPYVSTGLDAGTVSLVLLRDILQVHAAGSLAVQSREQGLQRILQRGIAHELAIKSGIFADGMTKADGLSVQFGSGNGNFTRCGSA